MICCWLLVLFGGYCTFFSFFFFCVLREGIFFLPPERTRTQRYKNRRTKPKYDICERFWPILWAQQGMGDMRKILDAWWGRGGFSPDKIRGKWWNAATQTRTPIVMAMGRIYTWLTPTIPVKGWFGLDYFSGRSCGTKLATRINMSLHKQSIN